MSFLLIGSMLCGLASGVIAGMFGVGGGIIIVPVLLFLFFLDGINPVIAMQLAVGTSLATIVVTNMLSTWGHNARGAVRWSLARQYVPGTLLGAWLGSRLAAAMSGKSLIMLFGLFEIFVGWKMLRAREMNSAPVAHPWARFAPWVGVAIGSISSLFGIGGGTLSVPALTLLSGLPMQQAVGTSSAIGIPLALAGTLGFVQAGWNNPDLPSGAVGFLAPVAFLGIVVGSLFTTPLGVRLAHAMDPVRLKKGFGIFLIVVGAKLLWR
ncbi:MAG: sulfite exporter TauE/SafE family protein [Magnetococcales bacterium]|nr:sulfite exporter TauE/SafE family protein [Magnetococcales bacterium]